MIVAEINSGSTVALLFELRIRPINFTGKSYIHPATNASYRLQSRLMGKVPAKAHKGRVFPDDPVLREPPSLSRQENCAKDDDNP